MGCQLTGLRPRRSAALLLALLAAAVLSASRAPSAAHAQAQTSPLNRIGEAAQSQKATGCGRVTPTGARTLHPVIDGRTRVVIVYIPRGYRPSHASPLLLSLHGTGQTAAKQESGTKLDGTADEHTFIVAYPQGARPAKTGFAWNIPGVPVPPGTGPGPVTDDLSFLRQTISMLRQHYCVDAQRIYTSGFSGGARMSSQLACDPRSGLAGLAAVSGLRAPLPCAGTRPVAVIAIHGTGDTVDPYNGHGAAYWTYSVPVAAERWATHNGCAAKSSVSKLNPITTITRYESCRQSASVVLYSLAGKPHGWPADTNEWIWAFLSAHTSAGTTMTPPVPAPSMGTAEQVSSAAPVVPEPPGPIVGRLAF